MAIQVSIHDAKTHLSRLLAEVALGEEVIIAKGNKPIARLIQAYKVAHRKPGSAKGKITIADDFDAPLPEDIIEDFEQ